MSDFEEEESSALQGLPLDAEYEVEVHVRRKR